MKMINKTIVLITFLLITAGTFYYFFIDTLTISQIVGKQSDSKATILLNIFDFDTGLTRYDLYRLSQKSDYWASRMRQVYSIQDPRKKEIEHEKLMAEMMEDPALKKIARKIIGLGGKLSIKIMEGLASIAAF
jgi:hypothetical protein